MDVQSEAGGGSAALDQELLSEPSKSPRRPVGAVETPPDLDTASLDAVADPPVLRPALGRLLWYCYGGSLPAEHHSWVLHDVTCRTWILRHFARWTMVVAPLLAVYLAFMPTPFATRLYTGIAFSLAIYVMSLVFILIDTDQRAVRAGYKHSQPQAVRTANSVERQRTDNQQRRERAAARRAARR
jgi:Family of unknown function (DUF5313)